MRWRIAAIIWAAFVCTGPLAAAQQSVDFGSISGRVTDPQGAVVPGAEVSARQMERT